MKTTEQRLEELASPGAAVLTIEQVAKAIGLNGPGAVQSIRNRVARETFPIPSRKNGKLRVFSITHVADWIDGKVLDEPAPSRAGEPLPVQVRKVRDGKVVSVGGRPTNAVRAERLRKLGIAYGRLLTDALDDWLRDHQASVAAALGDAIDEAVPDLPSYGRKRTTP